MNYSGTMPLVYILLLTFYDPERLIVNGHFRDGRSSSSRRQGKKSIFDDADGNGGNYFTDFSAGLNSLSDMAKDVAHMIGSIDDFMRYDDCTYSCPNGQRAVARVNYKPNPNGCGSFGVQINLHDLPRLTDCCNEHDVCYDTCGQIKSSCDDQLQRCAKQVCMESHNYASILLATNACATLSEMIHQTTSLLGCQPFRSSQRKACACIGTKRNEL